MMWARRIVLAVGMLCAAAAPRVALAVDVNGVYQVSVVDTVDNCTFAGSTTLNQNGSNVAGFVSLTLVSGGCSVSSGTESLIGTLSGNTITFGFAVGGLGTATLTGSVSNDGNFMSGSFTTSGPALGTWSATRAQHAAPALSAWSLTALALLLVWAGMRRSATR